MSKEFVTHIKNEVKRIERQENLTSDKAFVFWLAINTLDLTDDEAREATSYQGGNDKGIDLFWIDSEEGRIIIVQAKYSEEIKSKPKVSHLTALVNSLNWLTNPEGLERDGKPELAQAARDYLEAVREGYGVELWFMYAGPKCKNIEKEVDTYNKNPENIESRRTIRHYSSELLEMVWEGIEGETRRISEDSVTYIGEKPIKHEGHFGSALVVTVPGSEIHRLYEKYSDRLFARDVRLFLGVRKGSVNAGIAETLRDVDESRNFWAYNNGITIICDRYEEIENSGVKLMNFSIVNGCQTTVSISQAPSENITKVSVIVRIIAAPSKIVDDIIQYNNSQNPIRTWDIASQNRIQRRLKDNFAKLSKPYIYLVRRGTRPKDMHKFRDNGNIRLIQIDIMGQYAMSFRGNAIVAYKQKALIFSKFHDEAFPPDVRVEDVLFQWICGQIVKETVQEALRNESEKDIRILKKGGTLFVLSAMSKILHLRNGSTYMSDSSENIVTGKNTERKLKKYAEYSLNSYIQSVNDQMEIDKAELFTLIRQPEFLSRVLDRIVRKYEKDSLARRWVQEVLPKITLKSQ